MSWSGGRSLLLLQVDILVVVIIEEERFPVFDMGRLEINAGIPIDEADGWIVEENGFGFLEEIEAFGGFALALSLGDEGVEFGIGPARVIVTIAGGPEGKEGDGVHVIADPTGAGDLVFKVGLGVEIDFPFLVANGDFDA